MNPEDLRKQLRKYTLFAIEADKVLLDSRDRYEILKDLKDIKFAQIEDSVEAKTNISKRRKALLSKEWSDYLSDLAKTKKEYQKAKLELSNYDRMCTCIQMQISSINAELRQLNVQSNL